MIEIDISLGCTWREKTDKEGYRSGPSQKTQIVLIIDEPSDEKEIFQQLERIGFCIFPGA